MACVRCVAEALPCCCAMAITLHDSTRGRIDTLANVFAVPMSRRDRRLIEAATMLVPAVAVERCDILPCRDGRPPFQRRMGSMRVIEVLKCNQFVFQVRRGPEQHPINAFSSGSSHECMHSLRQRQVGHAVIEVPDVVTCRPESVGPVDDELGFVVRFLSGIGAALAGSMANKSNIVIDLRGWRTPSVSGEELQALGKSGPRYTAEITRGLPVPRG